MVIGTAIVGACLYYKRFGEPHYRDAGTGKLESCLNSESNLVVGFVIYGSYLYLFAEFAVRRFCGGGGRGRGAHTLDNQQAAAVATAAAASANATTSAAKKTE